MKGSLLYLDSSALVKLVLPEAETMALFELLPAWPQRVASSLSIIEVLRATRRTTRDPAVTRRAQQILDGIHCIAIDSQLLTSAGLIEPTTMRSLDALHLATALSLGEDLGAFVVYDKRLAEVATTCGLNVVAPH